MLQEKVKEEQMIARKNKDTFKSGFLTALYSEISIVGKNNGNRATTDEEAVAVIKKFIKGINETIKLTTDETKLEKLNQELAIYNSFLPTMITEEEIIGAVTELIANFSEQDMKHMGNIMQNLKMRYGNKLNNSLASKIAKNALSAH